MRVGLRTLSTAHEALAAVAGIGLMLVAAVAVSEGPEIPIGGLKRPSQAALLAAAVYLFSTAWLQFRASDALRAGFFSRGGAWAHLGIGHALVLSMCLGSTLRGATSRAYLSGLHQVVAAMATVAGVGLGLAVFTWIVQRRGGSVGDSDAPGGSNDTAVGRDWSSTVPWLLHTVACALAAGVLWYLETLPLPPE